MAIATPPAQRIASDFSPSITRQVALQTARAVYRTVVERAIALPGADAEYLISLASAWDTKLRQLVSVGSEAIVSDEAQAAFDYVTATVSSGTLDADALTRWVDAYPDAVAELFPPSALTFTLIGSTDSEAPARSQGNRQPALANAA